jgi:hypothetical protein
VSVAAGIASGIDGLREELLAWIAAGVSSFEVAGAARLPLPVWEAVLGEVLRQAPEVIFSAAGPLRPALARALGLAGFAQLSVHLAEVPTRPAAELLVQPTTPSLTLPSPRLRLSAAGGGALLVAATLSPSFGVVDPDAGALVLARRLADLRRERPALRAGAELRFLDTGDDRALAFLRSTPQDELLVIASLRPDAPLETTVSLPGREGSAATFDAVDLLTGDERRLPWRSGECPVTLAPGGALLLRLDR